MTATFANSLLEMSPEPLTKRMSQQEKFDDGMDIKRSASSASHGLSLSPDCKSPSPLIVPSNEHNQKHYNNSNSNHSTSSIAIGSSFYSRKVSPTVSPMNPNGIAQSSSLSPFMVIPTNSMSSTRMNGESMCISQIPNHQRHPDPTCDKCGKQVAQRDFRTHNKFCLGKLCNRCHVLVHGSYEEHKMVCLSRQCDRCGLVPTGSFTEHNRICKAAATNSVSGTNTNIVNTSKSPSMVNEETVEEGLVECGICLAMYKAKQKAYHENLCGNVCPYCRRTYDCAFEMHCMTCEPFLGSR